MGNKGSRRGAHVEGGRRGTDTGGGARAGHRSPHPGNSGARNGNPRGDARSIARTARPVADAGAPCPIMHECGGCEWLGLPYRKQLTRKKAAMEELFNPLIEEFGWDTEVEGVLGMGPERGATVTASDKPTAPRAFRHKAASPYAPGTHNRVSCGFFARGTHRIIECPACAVEAPQARTILTGIARLAHRLNIPAYDEDRRCGVLRHAVVRCGWRTGEIMVTLVTRDRCVPRFQALVDGIRELDPNIVTIAQNINPRVTNAILGGETHVVCGKPRMRDELLGCTFEISPVSFYQTNPQQTEILYQLAIDGLNLAKDDVLLDAYCGSGTIGLSAAHELRETGTPIKLIGVERNVEGIRDARHNAELNGLAGSATFISADATSYLQRAAADGQRIDALIMDPPRVGSTPEFLAAAAAMGPRRIAYISCNPATQARDLHDLGQAGYRLVRFTPVDMFPHTSHVETVAILERG